MTELDITTDFDENDDLDAEDVSLSTTAIFGAGALVGAAAVASYGRVRTFVGNRIDSIAERRELKRLAKENDTES